MNGEDIQNYNKIQNVNYLSQINLSMKKLLLIFLFLSYHTYSNYITPGTGRSWTLDSLVTFSGGNVTFSGGIYFVNDTVYVSSSDTLKLLNNITVKLAYLVIFNFIGTYIFISPV